jgi:mono/diheme cytochrome c family protein
MKNSSLVKKALYLLLSVSAFSAIASDKDLDADKLYQQHCQTCHGIGRLGAMGPALFPENLSRLRKNKAIEVIKNGLKPSRNS